MADIDLELGPQGPRLRFNLLRMDDIQAALTRWIRNISKELGIVEETTALAPKGVPAADSPEPSGMEVSIRTAHQLMADQIERRAQRKVDALVEELLGFGTAAGECEVLSLSAGLSGEIARTVGSLTAELPARLRSMIETTAQLAAFNIRNNTANEPTARSLAVWSATAFGTVIAEAFINAPMFKPVMGWMDGVSTAGVIGAGVSILGLFGGLAAAQMKRPAPWRRIAGALGVAVVVAVGALYLLGAAHYRSALHSRASDVAEAILTTMKTEPLKPIADFAVLPYMLVNIACMVLVAWKSIPMFGFGDLKRLKAAAEAAVAAAQARIDEAYAHCHLATRRTQEAADAMAAAAQSNATRAVAVVQAIERVNSGYRQQVSRVSDSKLRCERQYREIIEGCHPAGRHQLRFGTEPQPLLIADLDLGGPHEQALDGLRARAAAVAQSLARLTEEIDAIAVAAYGTIQNSVVTLEAELRGGTGAVSNVLQFRR